MRPFWSLFVLFFLAASSLAADWPSFRGPNGSGISDDDKVPTTWGEKKNHKWALELPGKGFSSPIVVGKYVFVTCWSGGDGDLSNLKRHLVCVDRDKGTQVWSKMIPAVLPEHAGSGRRGGMGYHGYATHTPVSDGDRVYVMFSSTGVLAFDMKGEKVWQQSVGTGSGGGGGGGMGGFGRGGFGSSSSPILYKDLVIVLAGWESSTIRAFDRKTGKEVWKENAGSLKGCYATPSIFKNKDGADELLVSVSQEVWGLNPTNGKLKWYAETGIDTSCTLVVGEDDVAYVVGGNMRNTRTAVKVGGKDDAKANVVWSKNGGNYVGSPVLYKGHLYWVDQRGSAVCIDAKTGAEVGRSRLGGNYYASMIVIKDKLYAVSREGVTHVLEANPKMKEIAVNKLSDTADFSGTPAVSNGQLFLRSEKYLHCIQAD